VRVLLTGANGFVGSHVLDRLLLDGHDVAVMLRKTSDTRFIEGQLPRVEVRYGSLESDRLLQAIVHGAEVVIHCAGKTKALRKAEYYAVNAEGTRSLLEACKMAVPPVRRFVHVSSLAAAGPGLPESPSAEDDEPHPVTAYGESKLLGERCVRRQQAVPYVILRPAAVYGPRDADLFLAFKSVRKGVAPLIKGGKQPLSLIYAPDVAEAVVRAVKCPACEGGTYNLAHAQPCTQRELISTIAGAMGTDPFRLYVPAFALYPACLVRGLWSRITGRPSIVNLGKIPEYTAPGWVAATESAARDLGFVAPTPLDRGVKLTLEWYEANGWL